MYIKPFPFQCIVVFDDAKDDESIIYSDQLRTRLPAGSGSRHPQLLCCSSYHLDAFVLCTFLLSTARLVQLNMSEDIRARRMRRRRVNASILSHCYPCRRQCA